MVKRQQLAVGGLTRVFNSSSKSMNNKQQDTSSPAASSEVLACHPAAWQWKWTSCGMHRPITLSFRQQQQQEEEEEQPLEQEENGHGRQHHDTDNVRMVEEDEAAAYYNKTKTVNSVCSVDCFSTTGSYSVDRDTFFASTAMEEAEADSDAEAVILQALLSDRLLYDDEPVAHGAEEEEEEDASCCRLIVKQKQSSPRPSNKKDAMTDNDCDKHKDASSKAKAPAPAPAVTTMFGGATAMCVDSHNPYHDFRESMEAMVMSQQVGVVKDWSWLEEMLAWYLRANANTTHGLIVAAFVDLLVALTAAADHNYSSSSSSSSSSPVATPPDASATKCSASSFDDCSCSSSSSSSSSLL